MKINLKVIIIYILVFFAYVLAFTDFSFSFIASALIGLATILALIGCIIVLLFFKGKARKLHALLTLVLMVCGILVSNNISYHKSEQSKEKAKKIITAIEQHRSVTGHYPKSLSEIGVFSEEDLITNMSFIGATRYRYSSTTDRFYLEFPLPAWLTCTYNSKTKEWSVDG